MTAPLLEVDPHFQALKRAPAASPLSERRPARPSPEARSEASTGTRWGAQSLGTGRMVLRNARTDAHVWAGEQEATGHRPPFNREEWQMTASRLGLMPDQEAEGWDYISRIYSKKPRGRRDHVVAEMEEALGGLTEFAGQPYGGFYVPMPHELKVRTGDMKGMTSWPWRTKAADKVWVEIERLHKLYPEMDPEGLVDRAYVNTKIALYELTPEDDALMGIAFYWLFSNLDGDEVVPPPVSTGSSTFGMKGTGQRDGHLTAPRGAP